MEGEESMNSVLDMLQLKCLGTLKWRCRLCSQLYDSGAQESGQGEGEEFVSHLCIGRNYRKGKVECWGLSFDELPTFTDKSGEGKRRMCWG